ncbi:MAG: hypothetical protein R2827_13200 [Bdellovibrionales bacterium]
MTTRRPLFWQLYPAFMVISIGSLFFVAVHFYLTLKQSLISYQDSSIKNQIALVDREVTKTLESKQYPKADKILKELGPLFGGLILIMDESGTVVASSKDLPENYPNSLLNQEVLDAMQLGYAKSVRFNRKEDTEYAYYAKALKNKDEIIAIIQVSKSLNEIYESLWSVYFKVLACVFCIGHRSRSYFLVGGEKLESALGKIKIPGAAHFQRGFLKKSNHQPFNVFRGRRSRAGNE